jgi:hypothetical protein
MATRVQRLMGWLMALLFPYQGGTLWDSHRPPESRS